MSWGTCAGCTAKDSEIAHLLELVESLRKENLNLVDARAASATFPRQRDPAPPPAETEEPTELVHASPGQVRNHTYEPAITTEQFEALFEMQEKAEREGAS